MADKNFYPAVGLLGGTSDDLDGIDGANLLDNDKSFTFDGDELFLHNLDAASGAGESSPAIIEPDDNPDSKRWLLIDKLRLAATGNQTFKIGSAGTLEYNESSPSGTDILGYNGYFYATRVYNAYLSDYADFIQLAGDDAQPGYCYKATWIGAMQANKRCQEGVLGISSDVYGMAVGQRKGQRQVPLAVAGWVLAHVDNQYYRPGTVLTNDKHGQLTKMRWYEKIIHPDRIVATYMKKEANIIWGPPEHEVEVNGRHWVKVK
jgi:hypothetical protein